MNTSTIPRLADIVLFTHDHYLKTFLHRTIERLGSFNGKIYELLPLNTQADNGSYQIDPKGLYIADERLELRQESGYWKVLAALIQVALAPLCVMAFIAKGPLRRHFEAKPLEGRLALWACREGRQAQEVVRRMIKAFKSHDIKLDISELNLSSLPFEICYLTNINSLDASLNNLKFIPVELCRLKGLKRLVLSGNNLESIPEQIEQLTNLNQLDLNYNKIQSIPPEVGRLTKLNTLDLSWNKLRTIPIELSNLTNLWRLRLAKNELEVLPSGLNFSNLSIFNLRCNPSLSQLPLSLGHSPEINFIYTEHTAIERMAVSTILKACFQQRSKKCKAIQLWKGYLGDSYNLSFIDELPIERKKMLNEWLLRLERTKDFEYHQRELCQIIGNILVSVGLYKGFREFFFDQVEANNSHCEDRAAMALNEIFLAWKIETLDEEPLSVDRKLALMVGVAKTTALRSTLQEILSSSGGGGSESVEIYLYYEIYLKDRLGLITAIQSMSYPKMGARFWIDESKLIETVNERYLDHLVDLDSFKRMVEAFENYQLEKKELIERFNGEMERLSSEQTYIVYKQRADDLKKERESSLKELNKKWTVNLLKQ